VIGSWHRAYHANRNKSSKKTPGYSQYIFPQNALDFPLPEMLAKGAKSGKRCQFSKLRFLWLLSPTWRAREDAIKSDAFSLGHSQAKRKLYEFVTC
jgi:hypothetical protein